MGKSKTNEKKLITSRLIIIIMTMMILFVATVMSDKYKTLLNKRNEFDQKINSLQEKIDYESKRSEELASQKDYTKTKEYLEKLARERIGLIADDEILIIPK
ncbi:MAG: septum formation initiator family protein [Eubacteriales bacterium]|nr:septum formation initiator family protein [Eubacteriales bacterium]